MIRSLWNLRRTNLNKTTTCLLLYRFQSNRIMPKAIVRCVDSEDTLNLSFIYSNPELGIKQRQFNFQRKKCEPLETAKTRICENVKRRAFKTNKKKKNKPQNGAENEHVTTQIDSEIQLTVDVSINQISCSADTPCKEAFIHSAILKIGDAVYDVVVNPPTVKSLSLPSNIMAGFPIYPKLEVEFTDKSQCSYSWYRTKTPINQFDVTDQCSASKNLTKPMPISDWEHIGNSFHYLTSIDDIGRLLRVTCTPRDATGEDGQLVEAVSPVTVSAGPGYCPFDGRHDFTQSPTQFGRYVTCVIIILLTMTQQRYPLKFEFHFQVSSCVLQYFSWPLRRFGFLKTNAVSLLSTLRSWYRLQKAVNFERNLRSVANFFQYPQSPNVLRSIRGQRFGYFISKYQVLRAIYQTPRNSPHVGSLPI